MSDITKVVGVILKSAPIIVRIYRQLKEQFKDIGVDIEGMSDVEVRDFIYEMVRMEAEGVQGAATDVIERLKEKKLRDSLSVGRPSG